MLRHRAYKGSRGRRAAFSVGVQPLLATQPLNPSPVTMITCNSAARRNCHTIFAACSLVQGCVHRCKTWFASDRFLVAPLAGCGSLYLPHRSVCWAEDSKSVRGVGGKGPLSLCTFLQFTNNSTSLSYKITPLKN